ncbi:S1C family serine protease [Aurantimicrobium photophilum]|uniref:Periplasmic serine endoprotease DegP n=1 Tax=Aurantimicrobium photophilum TaxID=1987356 RepID=A0A2Z3RYH0_9MICO|nr:trypsin-like peptidase domain-containing protein [Aurantimicrobium photophilum]AWR21154.1 Periplasmic serine endoprotease DegP precursor [Aurantimicrobium photophilum]
MVENNDKGIPEYYFPPVGESTPPPATPPVAEQEVPETFVGPAAVQERKQNKVAPLVAVAVAAALVGGIAGAGVATVMGGQNANNSASSNVQGITINNTEEVSTVTAVAAKASPSVVTISVTGAAGGGSGSGVILNKEGYVLTNNHVVTLDGADSNATITVQDNDGNIYPASIVGTDPTVDMAVLKIEGEGVFTPIEWADSSKLNVGDLTIAMGAPLGLAGTVTTGIVSALNRSIQVASSAVPDSSGSDSDSGSGDSSNPFNFDFGQGQTQTQSQSASISIPVIQTDAAINPGNSGGALLDSKGRLIGINVAIASAGSSDGQSGSIGVGFALPSNLAKRVSAELIENQKASHGLLGAQVSDAASKDGSTAVGAYIEKAVEGGAAAQAGIKDGDIVVRFNGVRITDANDLTAQVRTAAGGSEATVVVNRDGKQQTIKVQLGTLK